MKNLLIYIHPRRDFGPEEKVTIKIQIDNSLDLGWKKEDIFLVTNFPYEYNGVKALVVGDENYYDSFPTASKINTLVDLFRIAEVRDIFKVDTILNLFKKRVINEREIYWCHDLDVFQNVVITEEEIEQELGTADMGITDKGRMPKWNTGTIFFRASALDIFNKAQEIVEKYEVDDEIALMVLYTNNLFWATDQDVPANIPGMENAGERIKRINITYNLRMWNIRSTYPMAVKPIRAIHFHPFAKPEINELDFYMYGKNKINTVLMSERLIKIFHQHGIN